MIRRRTKLITFGLSTSAGAILAALILISVNASLLRIPEIPVTKATTGRRPLPSVSSTEPEYNAITERNLFRAKLQVEIPKPKTEKELEEEALSAIVKGMVLKGVMLGAAKRDNYAVIDRGGPKGVWTYEIGDVIERGLALKEIRRDSIRVEKGEFGAVLKLFSSAYERTPGSVPPPQAGSSPKSPQKAAGGIAGADLGKDIKKQGSVTLISKSLADRLKTDNNMVMSSVAVKAATDGFKVVAVDRGSIAQRIGITPDDTIQEINGYKLNSSTDTNKVYEALKNANQFDLKVLRRGKPETLRYEIR